MGLQVGVTQPDTFPARLGELHKRLKALKHYFVLQALPLIGKLLHALLKSSCFRLDEVSANLHDFFLFFLGLLF